MKNRKNLFNMSGHPTPSGAEEFDVLSLPVPTVDPTPEAIVALAHRIVDELPSEEVETGRYEMILPGMTPLAGTILAILHGRSGLFPRIRFSVRGEAGFQLSDPIDLYEIRLAARDSREEVPENKGESKK